MLYGWRAKIGVITPANGTAMEMDFHRYAPEGVATMTQRILFEKVDKDGLSALAERSVEAAKIIATAKPDLLLFGCTTGSLINGPGYDLELVEMIEKASGIPTITTSTGVNEALKVLGSKKLVISTPYSDSVNQAEKVFLEAGGYEVLDIQGLGYTNPNFMATATVEQMYKLTKSILRPEADTIFVSCTGIGVMDGICSMEADFGKPVITSNQISLWYALKTLGIRENKGPGSLFNYL